MESPVSERREAAEPWAPWESRLCWLSVAIGLAGLVILGALVNLFLL
ncbi:MAG: hypothetical protein KatS3mg121_1371 [Gammaproteobacteria bacterium]|nr:MAG: hypothetical protein KatS3mg121_1371 [Gammaproteobacteria bacterium]